MAGEEQAGTRQPSMVENKGKGAISLEAEIQGSIRREIEERRQRLETEFPGRVIVLEEGSLLFHRTGWPKDLMEANEFYTDRSNYAGSFHFTDKPIPRATNCQARTGRTLLLIAHDQVPYGSDEFRRIESRGSNFYEGAGNCGFDGFSGESSSIWVKAEDGNAREIIVLPRGLDALKGNITPYSSSSK